MLLSYKVKNFCSFAEEAEFDLIAPNNKVKKRFPDNYVETASEFDVLKTAIIIGENAGGKTNFIKSLQFFKDLFVDNQRKHVYRNLVNTNNLNPANPDECETKQAFDICLLSESNTIYHYYLEIDQYSIVKEMLNYKRTKNAKEKTIFCAKREKFDFIGEKKSLEISFKIDMFYSTIDKTLSDKIFSKDGVGLFVTKLAILGDEFALEFVDWVNNRLNVDSKPYNYYIYKDMQTEEDDLRIIHDERFLNILKMVDYSIDRIEVDEEKPFRNSKIIRKLQNGRDFSREIKTDSAGVMEFFAWAVQLFKVVYENKIVFADEMDRVINPILSERIVAFINGKKHNGQLIFSTHNVLHLDLKNYMKEQIYFVTKKRPDLNSELYSLADFPEVRYETSKIYEFYMKGILGGTAFE